MLSLALAVTVLPLASAIGADATVSQYSAECYGPGVDSNDGPAVARAHASADCTDANVQYDWSAAECSSVNLLPLLPGSWSALSELRTTSECGVATHARVY